MHCFQWHPSETRRVAAGRRSEKHEPGGRSLGNSPLSPAEHDPLPEPDIRESDDANHEVDLVICDLALPRGSGLELLRVLSDREVRVPAFLLCGAQQPLLGAAQLGAYCLQKPIETGALLETALRRIRSESGTKRLARQRVTEITEAVAATAAKNRFGQLLGAVMQGGRVVITRHDAPSAVVLSYEDYRELTSEDSPDLEALSHEFDELLERMQAPTARAASDALFAASPADLAEAARAEARGDTRSPEPG